jgi:hypothetical protein
MYEHHTPRADCTTALSPLASPLHRSKLYWGGRLGIGTARLPWCIPPGGAP